jgi:hypothetical protein
MDTMDTEEGSPAISPGEEPTTTVAVIAPDFVSVEKNLTSLGFFTPSSNKIKDAKSKVIQFKWNLDGKWSRASVTIVPAALYGLPITADQDKWLAFQKLITDRRDAGQPLQNPIGFTSAELIRVLGKRVRTGKNYQDIGAWLDVMTATTIKSEGAVYLAGKKAYATDRFHVFDRSVSFGRELDDGTLADKNYVWLSDWQLENLNNNHVLPIDFETYKQLKNNIAKALVPLLQIWLYATASERVFEKRYSELCQHLNIREYQYLSYIRQTLSPALDELVAHKYLAGWAIEKASDDRSYKVVLRHGEKFYRDRRRRLGKNDPQGALSELAGLGERASLPPDEPVYHAERALVSRFYTERYGQPQEPSPKEIAQAGVLLAKGEAWATFLVTFAGQQGRQSGSFPNDFGGVPKCAARARVEFQARRKRDQTQSLAQARAAQAQAHAHAYQAYLLAFLQDEFAARLPDAFAAFTADETRLHTFHQRRAAKSPMSARVADAFYTGAERVRRLTEFRKEHPRCGVLDFWEWDRCCNPQKLETGQLESESQQPGV